MLRRAAARVSAASRRRKLALFLELIQPTAETTVVDVGVSDGGYGEDMLGTANFFDPTASVRLVEQLPAALASIGAQQVADVVGTLRTASR